MAFGNKRHILATMCKRQGTHHNRLIESNEVGTGISENTKYYYDNNGNQLLRTATSIKGGAGEDSKVGIESGITSVGSGVVSNTFDVFNRLTSYEKDGKKSTYDYGLGGLRLSKTVAGLKTTHIWDGDQMVGELDSKNVMKKAYVRGLGLIGNVNSSNQYEWYLYNGHGDVTGKADNLGQVIKDYTYDTFGNDTCLSVFTM